MQVLQSLKGETYCLPLIGLELHELRKALGEDQPAFRARQLFDALYRQVVVDLSEISTFSQVLKNELDTRFTLGFPSVEKRYLSHDGTSRYLLKLADGRTVESVLMPEESRDTVCISSQVGCPVDCRFCLTALMGLERNLTAGEIVGQVLLLARENKLSARDGRLNVVMMGMGEPLLNLENVLKATRLLTEPSGFGMSPRRITVSTSGIIPRIEELGQAPVRPKLAISLNASTEEQRRELMPITRKYHLRDLMKACSAYPLRSWESLTFEYVLLKDVNDSEADARRVVKLLSRLKAKVESDRLESGTGHTVRYAHRRTGGALSGNCESVASLLHSQAARPRYFCRLRPAQAGEPGTGANLVCGQRSRHPERFACRNVFNGDLREKGFQPLGAIAHAFFFRDIVPEKNERFVAMLGQRIPSVLDRFPFSRFANHQHLNVAAFEHIDLPVLSRRARHQAHLANLHPGFADYAKHANMQPGLQLFGKGIQGHLRQHKTMGVLRVGVVLPTDSRHHSVLDAIGRHGMPVVVEAEDNHVVRLDEGELLLVDRIVLQPVRTVFVVIKGGLVRNDEVLALRRRPLQNVKRG